ncbi:enoyl-CoA hydratase [Flavivirga aquatica]|uniref:enoyl-CoA hydratase n=1 Tax=Flavivirga aquatica TaxID=1849968 RepID=A0A1E5TAJ6_9FLAO|nr:enoyl-CoA hydratase-related protein [Flavivirga aquatica]OEK08399.1 enoyl-CoA hydratase [Flavivirga aquatica]
MDIIDKHYGGVVVLQLNRPKNLNALNTNIMHDIVSIMSKYDKEPEVGCFVITGNEKAFAAGADIKEMVDKSYLEMLDEDFFAGWEQFVNIKTPKIAAVSGYALGGGCELAMMCDMVFAAENAKFGQPEIKLGVIPGIGGSQRLTKLIGRVKAMDMILTGKFIDAKEAKQAGLVSRIFPVETLLEETIKVAKIISNYSKPTTQKAKEVVNRAEEIGLKEGVLFERSMFHSLFATQDQKEGMKAFIEKRDPDFKGFKTLKKTN